MGEWKTVYADEVEGCWVTLRTYESEVPRMMTRSCVSRLGP
jgi:hypothetical protein